MTLVAAVDCDIYRTDCKFIELVLDSETEVANRFYLMLAKKVAIKLGNWFPNIKGKKIYSRTNLFIFFLLQ